MKRSLQLGAIAVIVLSCAGDRKITSPDQALMRPNRSGRNLSASTLLLTLSGSVSLKSPSGWTSFESGRIPLTVEQTNGRYVVGQPYIQTLLESLHGVPLKAQMLPATFHSLPSNSAFSYENSAFVDHENSGFVDPEEVVDQWAEANYVPADSSDIYVDQSTFDMMYGTSVSEDISGDGSVIATLAVDPISTTNPEGMIHLRLNGVEVATLNPRYAVTNGGWYTEDQQSKAYSYYNGQQTGGANIHYTQVEPDPTASISRTLNLAQIRLPVQGYVAGFGAIVGEVLLPKVAQAQHCHECEPYVGGRTGTDPCAFEIRYLLGATIGFLWNAHRGEPWGMLIATYGIVNGYHALARCARIHY